MATLTVQPLLAAGTTSTLSNAASGGDKVKPSGDRVFVEVANGGASSVTVTITSYASVRGQQAADRTVTVPASGTKKIPLYEDLNTSPADGLASISYSSTTSVTVGAFRS
ncbi:hypothetical protein [Streptomyces monomycini]|uniref:hypothetical protein n=1 Tax=Streptomyces monomycini TaxID=371720 RepID=UPI0004AB195D|nr:hypothetical protein [Streptomyces monomycini]